MWKNKNKNKTNYEKVQERLDEFLFIQSIVTWFIIHRVEGSKVQSRD